MPEQRSSLWALVRIATVPLALVTTMLGAGVLAIAIDRYGLWQCYPKRTLAELDFSLPTLGFAVGLCAVLFAVWWLALLPSPIPRNAAARRTLRLAVASIATLFVAAHAVFGLG
ncbi:hypothetical protein [Micropruina sp.]|uniref:hypothetical protein n=1 Tax=Micropruina sp. TaxID=2737536 RepID=UPI0039E470C3